MIHRVTGEKGEQLTELALELLHQGERWAKAGLLTQAEAIMSQVWAMSVGQAPHVANTAAWEAACLDLQLGNYAMAATWFGRVGTPPSVTSAGWTTTVHALIALCNNAGNRNERVETPARAVEPPVPLPPLQITNLGRFQIARAGQVLPACKARKALAILRYLLTRPHYSAHKSELMEMLWPDTRPNEAAHRLHVTVSLLRSYLNPPDGNYVLYESGQYCIAPGALIEDDAARFRRFSADGERAWREGDLSRAQQGFATALSYYGGDYHVDECGLPWELAERERLLATYLSVLDHFGRVLIAQALFEPAVECYQRLLERDMYREDAHLELMRCYYQLGQRSAAIHQYELCASILSRDLELTPMPSLQAFYQTIIST